MRPRTRGCGAATPEACSAKASTEPPIPPPMTIASMGFLVACRPGDGYKGGRTPDNLPQRPPAQTYRRTKYRCKIPRGLSDAEAARDTGEGRAVPLARAQGPRGLRAPLPMASRAPQGMAARAKRHRHRYLLPHQRRGAGADHALARSRDHPGRYRSRRLFRRNGGDRRPAPLGRHSRHHRRHHRPHARHGVPRDHPPISRRQRAIAPAARHPHPNAGSAGQRIQLDARQKPHLCRAVAAVAARSDRQAEGAWCRRRRCIPTSRRG